MDRRGESLNITNTILFNVPMPHGDSGVGSFGDKKHHFDNQHGWVRNGFDRGLFGPYWELVKTGIEDQDFLEPSFPRDFHREGAEDNE